MIFSHFRRFPNRLLISLTGGYHSFIIHRDLGIRKTFVTFLSHHKPSFDFSAIFNHKINLLKNYSKNQLIENPLRLFRNHLVTKKSFLFRQIGAEFSKTISSKGSGLFWRKCEKISKQKDFEFIIKIESIPVPIFR